MKENDPCETCLRWYECNGVDESCPLKERKEEMSYKQPGFLRQIWWVIKYAIQSWFEWQDAKHWAKEYHPAWVQFAKKSRHKETRAYYKNQILAAYRCYEEAYQN